MDQLLKKFEKIEINHSSCLEKEDRKRQILRPS